MEGQANVNSQARPEISAILGQNWIFLVILTELLNHSFVRFAVEEDLRIAGENMLKIFQA